MVQDDAAKNFVVELRLGSSKSGDLEKKPGEHHSGRGPSCRATPDDTLHPLRLDARYSTPAFVGDLSSSNSVASPLDPPGLSSSPAVEEQVSPTSAPLATESSAPISQPSHLPGANSVTDTQVDPESLSLPLSDIPFDIDPSAIGYDTPHHFLEGIPPLDTLIPSQHLPDILFVHDVDNITGLRQENSSTVTGHPKNDPPVRYLRVDPTSVSPLAHENLPKADARADGVPPPHVAHLYLKRGKVLGSGSHSTVLIGGLRLKLTPDEGIEMRRVAVKTADQRCGAHKMLMHEASMYSRFPHALMEGRAPTPPSGAQGGRESKTVECESECEKPQAGERISSQSGTGESSPLDSSESTSAEDNAAKDLIVKKDAEVDSESPVVPKFFGFYAPAPEGNNGYVKMLTHPRCSEDGWCRVEWPTPLLLMEECGATIDTPSLKPEDRCVVFLGFSASC